MDTNLLSELRRPAQAHFNVTRWADGTFLDGLHLSALTVLEIEIGCLRMERRDPHCGKLLRKWIEESVLVRYLGRILPRDTSVARECARLHVPDPKPKRDAIIAATAIVHNFTLVTRNKADFVSNGARLLNLLLSPIT